MKVSGFNWRVWMVLLIAVAFVVPVVSADDGATREECIHMCKLAAKMVEDKGLDAALAAVSDPKGPFVWKNSYVFCMDFTNGKMLAHPFKPKLIGKNLTHVKDVNGTMLFAEFFDVAKTKGTGWVDYLWPKPGEEKPSPKVSYVYRVPDTTIMMGAGVYE